jgi:arylsulfatase
MNFRPAGSTTAAGYDIAILPLCQRLWLEQLESFTKYPPLQAPETYNLTQVLQQVKAAQGMSYAGQ